ncbi:MAG: hypothetical protein ACTSWX_02940 [Promethearchaeota archaeon]
MAHYEEEEQLKTISEGIEKIDELNDRTLDLIEDAKSYAPDAADVAEDKLENAREKLDNVKEKLGNTWESLYDFKDKARIAAEIYDEAQMSGDPKIAPKVEKARYTAERAKAKLQTSIMKTISSFEKAKNAAEKANSRANIAAIKANATESREKGKKVRINFTLPENMKQEWKDLADQLNISISQMIRTAMDSFEKSLDNIGDFKEIRVEKTKKKGGLDSLEQKIERWGERLENYVKEQVDQRDFSKSPNYSAFNSQKSSGGIHFSEENKEKIQRRITGLIKINQNIPVEKLAKILNCTSDEAENLIYELAAEGIEGFMEKGVFRYENPTDEVITTLFNILEGA